MKSQVIILILFSLFSLQGLVAQDGGEIVKFKETTQALGKVVKGSKVKGVFTFENISKEDIEIDIVSTCDCTEAKWTRGPIKPGEKGEIKYTFDSSKKDEVIPVDIDIYFLNVNPKTENPYSIYLKYTFEY